MFKKKWPSQGHSYFTNTSCFFLCVIGIAMGTTFNSLLNDEILDVNKLKAFADDILGVAKMAISLFDNAVNTGGKREICWLPVWIV